LNFIFSEVQKDSAEILTMDIPSSNSGRLSKDGEFPQLGDFINTFTDIYPSVRVYLFIGLVFVFATLIGFVGVASQISNLVGACLALLLAATTLFLLVIPYIRAIINHYQFLTIYSNGFIFSRRKGVFQTFCWRDIEHVLAISLYFEVRFKHGFIVNPPETAIEVLCTDGRIVKINNYLGEPERIASILIEKSTSFIRERCVAQIEAGNSVCFGKFKLSDSELYYGSRCIPWSDVRSITQFGNLLVIERKGFSIGPWCDASSNQIPNFDLFLELADSFHGKSKHFES